MVGWSSATDPGVVVGAEVDWVSMAAEVTAGSEEEVGFCEVAFCVGWGSSCWDSAAAGSEMMSVSWEVGPSGSCDWEPDSLGGSL